jgi:dihydrolipoamide dehydrogenase
MQAKTYDAVVIGAGPGGYVCAIRLAQLGLKTLCIEKDNWGGVCLNVGCIPSKALITAAKRYKGLAELAEMGITNVGDGTVDMAKMQDWKQGIVAKLTGGIAKLLAANGAEMLRGSAELTAPGVLKVSTSDGPVKIKAKHIVIATGSRPIEIPGFSTADARIMDSTGALAISEVPKNMVVIGGGYIGLELGSVLNKLGSKITVIEMADQLLPGFDKEVVKIIARKLKKAKVDVKLKSKALGWEEGENGAVVHIEGPKGKESISVDAVLVTVGRFPNSENLGLEKLGVEMDGRFIKIDKACRTNVSGIYAIGDVAGNPMLAHKASHEGEVVAEVIAGHAVQNEAKTVPAVVFTDPEIATAGLQEPEALAAGYEIKVGKVPFAAIGRALTTGHTEGFIKVVLDATDDRVLGVTIVGDHASDLISEAALAIEMDAEAMDIGLTIHPHPTLAEGVMEATKAALGEAIHVVNR